MIRIHTVLSYRICKISFSKDDDAEDDTHGEFGHVLNLTAAAKALPPKAQIARPTVKTTTTPKERERERERGREGNNNNGYKVVVMVPELLLLLLFLLLELEDVDVVLAPSS